MILLPNQTSEDAALIARKIFASLESPFPLKNHKLIASANVGISIYPNDGDNAKSLLNTSYTALQRAKELGENTYQFYSPALTERAFERMVMENDLKFALQRAEFILHYQPQIDLKSGKIIGLGPCPLAEARRADLSKSFIYMMEEMGLIVPFDEWVCAACKQNNWQEAGFNLYVLRQHLIPILS
jgi:predicted signal transduction protein with EAL and GGDEF domain